MTDQATVWSNLTSIFAYSTDWTYFKVGNRQRNGRKGYLALRDHYLIPNNVDHMASAADKILQNAVYHGERKKKTFESYVVIQKEHHTIFENLEDHGYKGIDERLKVRYLIAGIKYGALNSVKAKILTCAPYLQNYDASVIIYKDYTKQAQDKNI